MQTTLRTSAFLALLSAASFAQAPLYDIPGNLGEQAGSSVAAVGDVDLDGFDDFAVGAANANGLQPEAGRVTVHSGRTGATLLTILGERSGDRFGWSVAGLGDITADGIPDLVVGAPRHEWLAGTDRGAVYTCSGANGAQIWKLGGNADGDMLGWDVAGPGDVDGDGTPDYAFSKPWGNVGTLNDIGIVWVHSGANHTHLRTYVGENAGDLFGYSIAALGDLNGDGVPDLVAGAPNCDVVPNLVNAGRGYVLSGAASFAVLWTKNGGTLGGRFGHAVAGVPRVDADLVPEVAFGEPDSGAGGQNSGRVRVFSGASQALLRDFVGTTGDGLGWSVDGLADFDSDGRGDVIIGIPRANLGPNSGAGDARVYSVLTGAVLALSLGGYHSGENMGTAVASAGDLNADGATDVLAGSPLFDGNFTDGGRVRVVLGSAPIPTTYCTAKVNSAGCLPSIGFTGCASVSAGNNFGVHALNVHQGVSGMMIWSLHPAAVPFQGGTLCVGSPIRRTPVQVSYDDPFSSLPCPGAYYFHFSHALMAANGLTPGTHVYAQYWSRDNGFPPPNNSGLTDGLEFMLLP